MMTRRYSQTGFSLIELMIAITLGMLLMGAAIQFFLSSKETYELNDELSRIQENGRIALDIMTKDAQQTGYPKTRNNMPIGGEVAPVFTCASNTTPCGVDGGGATSDRLAIQYALTPSTTTDCTGAAISGTTETLVNVYTIRDPENDGINSLYCRGYSVEDDAYLSNDIPLVDGVDNMQVLYRLKNNHSYRSLDRLTDDNIANIVAMRIALLVSSGTEQGSADARTREYQLLDSGTITYNDDRKPRRIYSTTVYVHNGDIGLQE